MSSIQQTLRKARQVDQKFKAFMQRKKQSDASMEQTFKKIAQTQKILASTKHTISTIDNLYDTFQKRFSQAIDSALINIQKNVLLNVSEPNWKPNTINQKDFVKKLKEHKQILILTGAGMGVASGIPTFRGANGFWNKQNFNQKLKMKQQQQIFTPEEILTLHHFQKNQFSTWKWITDFYQIKSKTKPNKGHLALNSIIQELINADKKVMITTQNIDNFHTEAKQMKKQKKRNQTKGQNKDYKICQIHGNILRIRCQNCSDIKKQLTLYNISDYLKQLSFHQSPLCPKCNIKLRPHIMFFDQFYSQLYNHSQTVQKFQNQTDLLIVIGTALQTGLSRQIVEYCLEKKIQIIEINIECQIKRTGSSWITGKADEILDKIKFQIWKTGL